MAGSVPGAFVDGLFDREYPLGGRVPGANVDGLFGREYPLAGSVPGAFDDGLFDPVSPVAARLCEPPAPISATVVMAPSDRSLLLMFHSFG